MVVCCVCCVCCVVLCVVWCGGVVCCVLWSRMLVVVVMVDAQKEVVVTFSLQKSSKQFVRNTKLAQNDKVTVYGARFLQNHHATFWKSMLNVHQSLAACLPLVAFSHTSSSVTQSQIFLVDSAI